MTVADDVAMSVQRSLMHRTTTSMVHIANAISGSESALVHELMQPAIHHVLWEGEVAVAGSVVRWWCGLFAFDAKGPPFRWLVGPSAPSSTAPGPLSAGPIGEDLCPDDLFPCSHSGKGRSIQLLTSLWEPKDPPTTLTPEPVSALMYPQQAGRSLAPIAGWMGYPAGQRPRSIPLWLVRGFHNHLPIDLLQLTLSILCVLSLSLSFLPSLLLFHSPPPSNQQHYAHQSTLRLPTCHRQTLLASQAMV